MLTVKAFEVLFYPEENHSWLDWGDNSFTTKSPRWSGWKGYGLRSGISLRLCYADITDIKIILINYQYYTMPLFWSLKVTVIWWFLTGLILHLLNPSGISKWLPWQYWYRTRKTSACGPMRKNCISSCCCTLQSQLPSWLSIYQENS